MKKQVLVISTSLRRGGNSEILAREFAKGAQASGNGVEFISLIDQTISFCRGCLACQKTQACVIRDDAAAIASKMRQADVLVFATPVYYYEMSGQMKTMLDRANPLYTSDYAFRDIYLLLTAAEDDCSAAGGAVKGLEGFIACYPKARLAGTLFAGGVDAVGAIAGHAALQTAYETGRSV